MKPAQHVHAYFVLLLARLDPNCGVHCSTVRSDDRGTYVSQTRVHFGLKTEEGFKQALNASKDCLSTSSDGSLWLLWGNRAYNGMRVVDRKTQ